MNCKICGAELSSDAKFCVTCGAPVDADPAPVAEPVAEPVVEAAQEAPVAVAEEPAASKVDLNAVKAGLIDTLSPLFAKIKPYLTNKKVLIGIGAALVLLIAISVIATVASSNNGFISVKQSVMPVKNGDEINLVVDKKVLSDTIESEGVEDYSSSIDGKVFAFTTDENELYVLNGKKLKKVAEDVADFEISVSGSGIAYVLDEEESRSLVLYTVSNGKTTTVTDELANTTYALSPDGKAVCYYVENDDEDSDDTLMYFKGSKSVKITSSESELFGLSNNGKYIYVVCENDEGNTYLYSYNTKGDRTKLGSIDSSAVRFNDDHTQVMFFNEGKTYISNKGKDAEKASSNKISLVIAPNAMSFSDRTSTTYPVSSLFDHVYTCSDGESTSVWVIKKNADKNVKLVSKVSGVKLDASAKYLYYIYNGEELRVIKISDGDNASEKFVTLAEDVTNYVVTSDRKYVYYTSDNTLYSVNGKKGGKAKTISSDDVSYSLAINAKDVVYYIMDGDLYATSNGNKGSKVVSDVSAAYNTSNGVVYAGNEDTIYATTGSKKLTKILDME